MTGWLPEWVFEGHLSIYAVLGATLIFVAVIWKQTPRPVYLYCMGLLAVLIGLYFLLDRLVVTDREQITAAFQEMSAGVRARNLDRIFEHVSDSFNRKGLNKAGFRAASDAALRSQRVDEVVVWGFEYPSDYKEKENPDDETPNVARVSFMAKAVGDSQIGLWQVHATMHRDPDGKWRLQNFTVFDPYHNQTQPVSVPGLD